MYSKIALNNVKKSFKDYAIYFLTIAFAVCIFYSFNSIESQRAVLKMNSSQAEYVDMVKELISYVSVFVSFILGGLILYANNFLIKKRKKELGIYMTLGMSKRKISKILIGETSIVGVLSLGAGLLLGVVLSQGLSLFTAKLFQVGMTDFKFIVSISAITKTILYFALIFGVLIIFNTTVISKYKLIDMLTAGRKNEEIKLKNPFIASMIFVLSILLLITAYFLVNKSGLNISDSRFTLSIILGIIGTVLFFYGAAGFLLYAVQKNKNIYLRNLNIFVARQISSKINTNFISIAVISLMLFITIVTLSTGLSFKSSLEEGIVAPFDASAEIYQDENSKVQSMKEAFEKLNFDFKENDYTFFDKYILKGINNKDIMEKYADKDFIDFFEKNYYYNEHEVEAIKLSDYNNIRRLYGKSPLHLKDNEVLVTSNIEKAKKTLENLIDSGDGITINGEKYEVANKEILEEATYNSALKNNILTLIVPDSIKGDLKATASYVDINYKGDNKEETEKEIVSLFQGFRNGEHSDEGFFILGYTKEQIYNENRGTSAVILYIGIYLGIVFLISSAAVLALQQLSEGSDSIDRYKALKKIGATEKMINKTIFTQTVIYFMMPLGLALVSSMVGISVVNKFLSLYGNPNIGPTSLMTLGIMVVVYGGYFYTTYTGYKGIVKSSK